MIDLDKIDKDDSSEFFEELSKNYPELMEKSNVDYIGVDKGWWRIIEVLCMNISFDVEQAKYAVAAATKYPRNDDGKFLKESEEQLQKALDELPVIAQIKEKFGTLRFYVHGGSERVSSLIRFAETMSAHTCEVCGKPGKIDTNGWHKVYCPEHARPDGPVSQSDGKVPAAISDDH